MCCVHGFVTEYTVNGKVTCWLETSRLVGKLVKHLRRYSRGVSSKKILECLFSLEIITISNRSSTSTLMHILDSLKVIFWNTHSRRRFLDEKRIMGISCRMALWLKQGIKIPKRTLYPFVRRHLLKTHLHQNLTKFSSNLEQRMKVSSSYLLSQSEKVVWLERHSFPLSRIQHFLGQICRLFYTFGHVLLPSNHRIGLSSDE
mmetsp:Transcript_2367/g.4409  ORF Transcript_2367/g.4409 Transcript_2367/m.4409 type:complete len:202 (-) Transcript_2367:589-1194(-)